MVTPGAMVLTTGAASTFARVGRYIQLGPAPTTPRELAHEFGHLLGFTDGYLRSWEGQLDDPFGVVFYEWTGLLGDLMDSPKQGHLSTAMVEKLIAAYGPK